MARATPRLPFRSVAAFTLVEVTLALGIVAVSLLSLIGLLPAGLGVLRESMDQTVHAQIVQRIAADVAASDFSALGNRTLSFDGTGQLLAAGDVAEARYSARIESSSPSLPGLTKAEDVEKLQNHLKRIRIGISRSNIQNAQVAWYAIQVASR